MATTKKTTAPKVEASEEKVPVEEEVNEEPDTEEEKKYSGGEIPRVTPPNKA